VPVHLAYCKFFVIKVTVLLDLKPNNGKALLTWGLMLYNSLTEVALKGHTV
jgi:hypothetical protein